MISIGICPEKAVSVEPYEEMLAGCKHDKKKCW